MAVALFVSEILRIRKRPGGSVVPVEPNFFIIDNEWAAREKRKRQ